MMLSRFGFSVIMACVALPIGAQTNQWEAERKATREQRIAGHQGKINEIIQANRVVSLNATETSETAEGLRMPRVLNPTSFESNLVPILTQAQVTPEQLDKLRTVNSALWDMRVHDKDATSPEVSAKVKSLLRDQDAVLPPMLKGKVAGMYSEEMKKKAEAAGFPRPVSR